MEYSITRSDVIRVLREALEPLEYVYAMWESGAVSFERADEWSDIDLQVDAADERVNDVITVIERSLSLLSAIRLKYEAPFPTWHGHREVCYRLKDTSPFLLIDILVINTSNLNKGIQPEIHGNPSIIFDKAAIIQTQPLDQEDRKKSLHKRVEVLRVSFEMFQVLVIKEIRRGNYIEAIAFYHRFTLRPLLELLWIQYEPDLHNFYTRYIYYYWPRDVTHKIERLFFVADIQDLSSKMQDAQTMFDEALSHLP